jgi:hypothetical protein
MLKIFSFKFRWKKAASSRDEIYEENCWFYTSEPQKKIQKSLKNLKVEQVSKVIQNYHATWKDYTERMDSNRTKQTFALQTTWKIKA